MRPELKEAWSTIMDLSRMCCSEKHNDAMIEIERTLFKGIQDTERLDYLNNNFFHREEVRVLLTPGDIEALNEGHKTSS